MLFNDIIKTLRNDRNLTQVQVAQACNITDRQYQRLEAGDSKPTYEKLIAIANYFDVSIDYLVGRTDNPKLNV